MTSASTRPSGARLGLIPAAVGLLLSAVLEQVHVRTYLDVTAESFCSLGASLDCHAVALSRFSVVAGVPLPIWGIVGFTGLLLAAARRSPWYLPLAALATFASLLLFLESLVHIGALCLLCEGVHLSAIACLVLAILYRAHAKPMRLSDTAWVLGVPSVLLGLARVFVPAYWILACWATGVPVPTGVTSEGHPWMGAREPDLEVHEFVDYACPHCAVATSRMRMNVVRRPGLRVVRRHQPRVRCKPTSDSCLYVRAALCAQDQGKFWEMDSWLFTHAPGNIQVDLRRAVRDVGLDESLFHACVSAPPTFERADALAEQARVLRIRHTPAYRVDGETISPKQLNERL